MLKENFTNKLVRKVMRGSSKEDLSCVSKILLPYSFVKLRSNIETFKQMKMLPVPETYNDDNEFGTTYKVILQGPSKHFLLHFGWLYMCTGKYGEPHELNLGGNHYSSKCYDSDTLKFFKTFNDEVAILLCHFWKDSWD